MAINWGPTRGANTAAQRHNRDVAQRGGEVSYSGWESAPTTITAAAVGGRNNREFDRQGDDVVYTFKNGANVAVKVAKGRAAREYVNAADNLSAITGTSYATLLAAAIAAA